VSRAEELALTPDARPQIFMNKWPLTFQQAKPQSDQSVLVVTTHLFTLRTNCSRQLGRAAGASSASGGGSSSSSSSIIDPAGGARLIDRMANPLATIPPALKKITPYVKRAEEVRPVQQRVVDGIVVGWRSTK
jgi:hypothetical protein